MAKLTNCFGPNEGNKCGWSCLGDDLAEVQKHVVFAELEDGLAVGSYCDVLAERPLIRPYCEEQVLEQSLE